MGCQHCGALHSHGSLLHKPRGSRGQPHGDHHQESVGSTCPVARRGARPSATLLWLDSANRQQNGSSMHRRYNKLYMCIFTKARHCKNSRHSPEQQQQQLQVPVCGLCSHTRQCSSPISIHRPHVLEAVRLRLPCRVQNPCQNPSFNEALDRRHLGSCYSVQLFKNTQLPVQ